MTMIRAQRVGCEYNEPHYLMFAHMIASMKWLTTPVALPSTEVQLEQKSVPTAVFGGLKED